MVHNARRISPAASCGWRIVVSDPGMESQHDLKRTKNRRRKRMELRRLKSMCQMKSVPAGVDRCSKRRRLENKEIDSKKREFEDKQRSVISFSSTSSPPSPSSDNSSENDTAVAGISSVREDALAVREDSRMVTCSSHGSFSVIGRRRSMEDALTVELGFLTTSSRNYDFFGVYDGHGGSSVAHVCRDRLHRLVVKELEEEEEEVNWEKVMVGSFWKMDQEVIDSGTVSGSIGSTAVVAVVGEEVVVVANCGDSRAVLSRGGVAVALSNDHKPDRPDELERIEISGGRVINWNGQRVLGVLTTSRSIGDHYLKPFVISQPEVTVSTRTNLDEFLILASDGLWDVISNEVACQVVRRCLNGQMGRRSRGIEASPDEIVNQTRAAEAAALLVEFAMARGSKDNISVIVVELKQPSGFAV